MPMLADVYGLYYNKDMFAAKGITSPPKTTSELLEDTKKLTECNADGSIKVAGFLPSMRFYANQAQYWAPNFGAPFLGPDGKSDLASNPGWKAMFEFQKQLIDFYGGHDKVEKFKAGLGDEYSADHGFQEGQARDDLRRRVPHRVPQGPERRTSTTPPRRPRCSTTMADQVRRRLHHRHDHRDPQGRQEPRRRVGADQDRSPWTPTRWWTWPTA